MQVNRPFLLVPAVVALASVAFRIGATSMRRPGETNSKGGGRTSNHVVEVARAAMDVRDAVDPERVVRVAREREERVGHPPTRPQQVVQRMAGTTLPVLPVVVVEQDNFRRMKARSSMMKMKRESLQMSTSP